MELFVRTKDRSVRDFYFAVVPICVLLLLCINTHTRRSVKCDEATFIVIVCTMGSVELYCCYVLNVFDHSDTSENN